MVDLEPGVLNNIAASEYGQIFNPENMISANNGAGNCWASGFYSEGSEVIYETMEKIRQQAEKCESMEGFNLTHSLGGGTGSGLGSLIMKEVKGEYHDKILSAYSVFPSASVSDTVVEPYNMVLSMNHMIEECDINIVLDNDALYNILNRNLKQAHPTYSQLNRLIQRNILSTTSSLRFGGLQNGGLRKIVTNICPFPRMHFMTTTVAPLTSQSEYESLEVPDLV